MVVVAHDRDHKTIPGGPRQRKEKRVVVTVRDYIDDLQREILRLLLLHDEQGGIGLPTLIDVAEGTGKPHRVVRLACDALEADRYIHVVHTTTGDSHPSYEITSLGKAALALRK